MRENRLIKRCLMVSLVLHGAFVLAVPVGQHAVNPFTKLSVTKRFAHVKLITQPKPEPEKPKVSPASEKQPAPRRTVVRRRLVTRRVRKELPKRETRVAKAPGQPK